MCAKPYVREALRARGHEAWSCDILESEIPSPYHLQCDVRTALGQEWGALLGFPPCTDLCVSGARHFAAKRADGRQQASIDFFMTLANADIEHVAIENPIGIMSSLWLRGLPLLQPTNIVAGRVARVHRMPPSPTRSKERSRTYAGIAAAIADQWFRIQETANYKP